jgi:hypothetical protein
MLPIQNEECLVFCTFCGVVYTTLRPLFAAKNDNMLSSAVQAASTTKNRKPKNK